MYCNQCNHNTPEGAEFCPFCGGPVSENISEKKDEIQQKQDDIPKEQNEAMIRALKSTSLNITEKMNLFNRFIGSLSKVKMALILAGVLLVVLAGLNILQLTATATLKADYATLESDMYEKNEAITSLQAEKSTLEDELYDAEQKSDFLDDNIALVPDDGTNLYHTYDCIYFTRSSGYWAYNTENAIWQGYYACPYCH
jgi:hypothetical protein